MYTTFRKLTILPIPGYWLSLDLLLCTDFIVGLNCSGGDRTVNHVNTLGYVSVQRAQGSILTVSVFIQRRKSALIL